MATVLDRPSGGPGPTPTPPANGAVPLLRRPQAMEGFWSWITTVDHKRIGILYGITSMVFFLLGGLEALLIRLQLAQPNADVLSADAYNQVFTMHGTTMVFLVVMPLSAAFFNYLAPIMVGARDVAFPRLNALSYWIFLMGGLFIYSSFLLGGAPDGGWFGYAPNTSITFSPGHNIDYWIFGLQILGIASVAGAVNLITTILNLRAPGMTLMRMPVFVWMTLVANFLLLFAMPIITVALFLLMFDRQFGANFFNPAAGGDPVLWQHLFWLFGHPEVYILILPAMGIVSEILPTFSRKPLFGYPVVVFSGIAIGFMGWGVWAHHMFAVGLGPVAVSAFSVATMFIAVPTGVKIFNWVGTMWGGSLRLKTPMLFAIGFIAMFTIGGLSGVTHSISPHDRQQTDTYYIVAHFHYVLFGGSMFGLMGGFYYWWPKVFGYTLNDKIGKVHFWSWLIGFNLAFAPMHWLGLQGMPRRIYTYDQDLGLTLPNVVSTVGAFIIALSTLVFLFNVWSSHRTRTAASADPWDGRTLEWTVPSPTPVYNFAQTPTVHAVDDFWHRKYTEDDSGRLQRIPRTDEELAEERRREDAAVAAAGSIHLPSPSFYPIITSFGLPIIAYGMVYKAYLVAIVGGIVLLSGLYGWSLEPSAEPHHADEHDPEGALEGEHGIEDAQLVAAGDAPAALASGADGDAATTGSSPPANPRTEG
ncbi:MAG TPA: cytochrome c oxidase subunit I [Acidimicrobiales bacterium]|nr:cytochrome c oxidase subunit I [Acidimicrobiales bacterium]